ncbi:hypothetical protein LJC27_05720 [Christensenellaceae bacterium OttesenSCG-928-M15]|nr:hypothetical protein [Christensenellaceae bacterium OttesenSCG-928-M15]
MLNRNKKYIIAITAVLLLLFAGCAEQHTDQPNEAEMHIEQKTFSVSPEDFTSAMLYDKKITTLVFRVQGINMTENEINGYADRLNTVAAIVLEQEIDCPPALFAEVQTISVSGATFESIFSSDDITIMMVPEN